MYPIIRSLILVCLAICLSGCAPDVEKPSLSDPLPSTAIAVTAYSDWSAPVNLGATVNNLSGAFYMSKAALPHMVERGYGRIVNISSIIGERGNVGQANYASAKSGLFGLTMSLALETAKDGITVNCVAPGFVATDMVAGMPEDALDRVIAQIPVGRLGRPDEVARVVEFLAHPDASYITGQVYSINGGLYM